MKHHERTAARPHRSRQGRVALRPRRPSLSRCDQLLVGQPLRPRESAHQRCAERSARHARTRDARRLHARTRHRTRRASVGAHQHTLGHAFFASDGASAVEIALKMSFHFWRNSGHAEKREFVCLANSYHGETIGALGVTDVALFKDAYDPLIRHAHVVTSPDARSRRTRPRATSRSARSPTCARSSTNARTSAARDRRAAGAMRGRHGHARSVVSEGLARLCDDYGVHLIADEIAVGCGRTGTFFACEQAAYLAGLPVFVEGHQRRLSAVVDRADTR